MITKSEQEQPDEAKHDITGHGPEKSKNVQYCVHKKFERWGRNFVSESGLEIKLSQWLRL